jgi:hypothetical protein
MFVNMMAGSQDSDVAGVHAIGTTLAVSHGVPEGIAAIQQDLVLLDRTTAAGAVGLEALIQLAERLRTLGPLGVMPIATRASAPLSEISPTVDSRPDLVSVGVGGPAFSLPARDARRLRISTRAEDDTLLPPSASGPEPATLVSELSLIQSVQMARHRTSQEPGFAAPTAPGSDLAATQVAPAHVRNTSANPETTAPADHLPVASAPVSMAPSNAAPNTGLATLLHAPTATAPAMTARTTSAPMTTASVAARAAGASGFGLTPTYETMIAAARSQESLLTGPSAPMTAPPSSQLASIGPIGVPQSEAALDQVMPNNVQRASSRSRQPPESAAEPREGLMILDGAQLGRWIIDRIARQASRPVAGTTGIDPRISPIFPGAPASV